MVNNGHHLYSEHGYCMMIHEHIDTSIGTKTFESITLLRAAPTKGWRSQISSIRAFEAS